MRHEKVVNRKEDKRKDQRREKTHIKARCNHSCDDGLASFHIQ